MLASVTPGDCLRGLLHVACRRLGVILFAVLIGGGVGTEAFIAEE